MNLFPQYRVARRPLEVLFESLVIVMFVIVVAKVRFWNEEPEFLHYARSFYFALHVLAVFFVIQACCCYYKAHSPGLADSRVEHLFHSAGAVGVGYAQLFLIYYVFPNSLLGRGVLAITVMWLAATVSTMRFGLDIFGRMTTRERNVLILGNGRIAMTIARELHRADAKCSLIGFVAPGQPAAGDLFGHPILGGNDSLCSVVRERRVCRIIVALDDSRGMLPISELVRIRVQGVEVEDAPSALANLTGRIWLQTARPSWFVFSSGFRRSTGTLFMKRIADVILSVAGIVLCAPLMGIVAIAIRLESPGPVLYRQARVGLRGRVFELLKFRSMQLGAEAEAGAQWAQENDHRVTRVGRFLRKHRLDELPQFLNVLRGEMSFVGPRPERPVFVEQLREQIPFYDERHSVRPGVTGWAQVSYGYGSNIEDAFRKLEYDLFYLRRLSLAFDMLILFRTIRVVLLGCGR